MEGWGFFRLEPVLKHILKKNNLKHGIRAPGHSAVLESDSENEKTRGREEKRKENYSKLARTLR